MMTIYSTNIFKHTLHQNEGQESIRAGPKHQIHTKNDADRYINVGDKDDPWCFQNQLYYCRGTFWLTKRNGFIKAQGNSRFHKWEKHSELYSFIRKTSPRWSSQAGQIILTAGQFACCQPLLKPLKTMSNRHYLPSKTISLGWTIGRRSLRGMNTSPSGPVPKHTVEDWVREPT